jgi:hypothetical protein
MKNYIYETADFVTVYKELGHLHELYKYIDKYVCSDDVDGDIANKAFAACVRAKEVVDKSLSADESISSYVEEMLQGLSKMLDILANDEDFNRKKAEKVSILVSSQFVILKNINEALSLKA